MYVHYILFQSQADFFYTVMGWINAVQALLKHFYVIWGSDLFPKNGPRVTTIEGH